MSRKANLIKTTYNLLEPVKWLQTNGSVKFLVFVCIVIEDVDAVTVVLLYFDCLCMSFVLLAFGIRLHIFMDVVKMTEINPGNYQYLYLTDCIFVGIVNPYLKCEEGFIKTFFCLTIEYKLLITKIMLK